MITFILNDKEIKTDLSPGFLLLDFIRYKQKLTGTKIGCREGDCGACAVLCGEIINDELRYRSATCCLMPLGNAQGKHIVTIEGVNMQQLNPAQQMMSDEGATQCGFCTPGFIVSFAGFCLSKKEPSYQNAINAVNGNICRCTGYKSIERAAKNLSGLMQERNGEDPIDYATDNSLVPLYFKKIEGRLKALHSSFDNNKRNSQPSKYLGGGTDLYVQQPEVMIHSGINFLFDNNQLKGIEKVENKCVIGASATVTDLIESPLFHDHFPDIFRFVKLVSSTPIRNMATISGNFINASPIGDLTIFFLALDAQLILNDGKQTRELALKKLYKGYKSLNKNPEETVEKIWFELPCKNTKFNFEKVSKRTHLDIASVNTAINITMNEELILSASISAGGVGPVPLYLSKTSAFFQNKILTEELIEEAIMIAQSEIAPISDARGSEKYKRLLLSQLIKAHFITLFPEFLLEKLISF